MDISYDIEADAAYRTLAAEQSESQVHSIVPPCGNGEIILDFNAEGRFIGIEILGAQAVLPGARAIALSWSERLTRV